MCGLPVAGPVRFVVDRIDEVRDRDPEVVPILPEPVGRTEPWQERRDPPSPLPADDDAAAVDGYDRPVRFGPIGRFTGPLGRTPEAAIADRRPTERRPRGSAGRSTIDRQSTDDPLAGLDELRGRDGARAD